MILVTGGSGFIGANFILNWFSENEEPLVNLDKLTYASNQDNLKHLKNSNNYFFEKGSIEDLSLVTALLEKYQPRAVINFAAESHVDNSFGNSLILYLSNIFEIWLELFIFILIKIIFFDIFNFFNLNRFGLIPV